MTENKITFGKIFWPTLLAAGVVSIIGSVFYILLLFGIIGSLAMDSSTDVVEGNVLHLKLEGQISERSSSEFDVASFNLNQTNGLPDIIFALDKAKTDENIKGIFIDIDNLSCGISTARSIRQAIADFQKESKKFVTAYYQGEYISKAEYLIGSVAKETYAFPTSNFELTGLGSEAMFFKNMLDKLEIDVEIVRGENNDFKSAVEPFFLTSLSDSARLQNQVLLNSIWTYISNDIVKSRNLKLDNLNTWINNMEVIDCQSALKHGLIDGLMYKDEFMSNLAKRAKVSGVKDLIMADFTEYAKSAFLDEQILAKAEGPSVAVIVAEGEVAKGGDGVNSDKICKYFEKVRNNDDIKAVVFRINSPGGSALASEEIWREVKLTQMKKKVIVSMGDVAASGGYYIATPAERIFAEPTTITGSIGVFGMIPYTGRMFENKIGLSFDRVQTHEHSVVSMNKKLTPIELAKVQKGVNDIYTLFMQRVSDGRNLTMKRVNQVARGRVWSGVDAQKIGLVDELGGLTDAIAYAQKITKTGDDKVLYYPLVKEDEFASLIKLLKDEVGDEEESIKLKRAKVPKLWLDYFESIQKWESRTGIQMRMPYDLVIN